MGMEGAQTIISTPLPTNPPPALMWEQNQVAAESGNRHLWTHKTVGRRPGASLGPVLMVTSQSLSQGATRTAQPAGREGARPRSAEPVCSGEGLKKQFSLGESRFGWLGCYTNRNRRVENPPGFPYLHGWLNRSQSSEVLKQN